MAGISESNSIGTHGFEEKPADPGLMDGGLKTPHRQDGPHLFVLYMFVLPSAVIVPLGKVCVLPGCLSVREFCGVPFLLAGFGE